MSYWAMKQGRAKVHKTQIEIVSVQCTNKLDMN